MDWCYRRDPWTRFTVMIHGEGSLEWSVEVVHKDGP